MKKINIIKLSMFFFTVVLLFSCKTYPYDRRNPYPNMEILKYSNSQAYLFPNEMSDKLIIVMEGSGSESVLGTKQNNIWSGVGMASQFLQELGNDYTFLIPEKLKRQPGKIYFNDIEDRASYTAENLITCYIESINNYLAANNHSSVILIGASEGAALLPIIYENMDKKNSVTAMVSLNYGGYSLYESYKILSEALTVPQEYRNMYKHIVEVYEYMEEYKKTIDEELNISPEEDFYGFNYRWHDSFLRIRPFDYFIKISIPVLFSHGEADYNVPVESTRYIQENLPRKPFEYIYYHWDHQPRNYNDIIQFRKDISEWIMAL